VTPRELTSRTPARARVSDDLTERDLPRGKGVALFRICGSDASLALYHEAPEEMTVMLNHSLTTLEGSLRSGSGSSRHICARAAPETLKRSDGESPAALGEALGVGEPSADDSRLAAQKTRFVHGFCAMSTVTGPSLAVAVARSEDGMRKTRPGEAGQGSRRRMRVV
jgi:hypothetical protein